MTTFDPMHGPAVQVAGKEGGVWIAGMRAGTLTSWRLVFSPTAVRKDGEGNPMLTEDGKPIPAYTLFGEGHLLRFFLGSVGSPVRVRVVPARIPARIGRPAPPIPRPFVVTGLLFSITPSRIVISEGAIEPAHG